MSSPKYPKVDIVALGKWYAEHVWAMTEEDLHDKSDIAAQLAWRDKRIAELEELYNNAAERLSYLADRIDE